MANMSYCRFRNTRIDMDDCLEALRNCEELSKDEYRACKYMFEDIVDFLIYNGVIEDEEEIKERLQDFFNDIEIEED